MPRSWARVAHDSRASSKSRPPTITSAPRRTMASTLPGLAPSGTQMAAGVPSRRGRVGDRLAVVAGGRRDDAPAQLVRGQLRHQVDAAAHLERPGRQVVLVLHPHLGAHRGVDDRVAEQGSGMEVRAGSAAPRPARRPGPGPAAGRPRPPPMLPGRLPSSPQPDPRSWSASSHAAATMGPCPICARPETPPLVASPARTELPRPVGAHGSTRPVVSAAGPWLSRC